MSVRSVLITTDEDTLGMVNLSICPVANFIDRRGQTSRWTVFGEDFDRIVNACKANNATCQEIVWMDQTETYPILHQGTMEPWKPRKTKP